MATLAVDRPSETNPAKSRLQEAIRESTNALVAQLQAGKSDALVNYLATMAKFHSYSFGNVMAIARQKPTATQVAGFHKWLELRRYVRKGEKGIAILAPLIIKGKREESETQGTSQAGPRLIGFKVVYVFDVSQTDGEPLADFDISAIRGEPGQLTAKLKAYIQAKGIPVSYDTAIAPARGISTPTDIKLLPDMTQAEEFAVLCHEFGHALLHQGARRKETTKTVRETEAEAVSFIVATACGLDCGTVASDYIQMYDGNTDTLLESLQHVQGAASKILAALES